MTVDNVPQVPPFFRYMGGRDSHVHLVHEWHQDYKVCGRKVRSANKLSPTDEDTQVSCRLCLNSLVWRPHLMVHTANLPVLVTKKIRKVESVRKVESEVESSSTSVACALCSRLTDFAYYVRGRMFCVSCIKDLKAVLDVS